MEQYKILTILLAIQISISTASKILYVLPDNSTDVGNCPSQPCATLSQYLLDNDTLPVLSNVEYHFLPGEHHVPANMTIRNLHNFSIIGTVSKPSPLAVLVLVDYPQSYIINIIDSYNVTIANVMLKQCDHPQLTNVLINSCYSCTLENLVFINLGMIATNLVGRSHLTELVIKSKKNFYMFCQQITLNYWNLQLFTDHKHLLVMNQINMTGDMSKCYRNGHVGLYIYIEIILTESLTITITNSFFYNLDHTALTIINQCYGYNKVKIENCTFENNYIIAYEEFDITLRPLIEIVSIHSNKLISFKQCNFKGNHHVDILIKISVKPNSKLQCYNKHSCSPVTNITFVLCQFTQNVVSELINIFNSYSNLCTANILIIGPSHFTKTRCSDYKTLLTIYKWTVKIIGPVIISSNKAHRIMRLEYCDVTFYNKITFKSNNGARTIHLTSSFIKIMENANITLLKNRYKYRLITIDYREYNLNPQCPFQFIAFTNTTAVSPAKYSINIINNICLPSGITKELCLFPLYHFTPHCKWIPTAEFHGYSPKVIYQQIIKTDIPKFTYEICHCTHNGSNNCSVDTLGPVYPGQMLQVGLCTPFNDKPSTLYAEVNSIHLPTSTCKVAPQTEIIYTISKYTKNFTFIIVSEATDLCELFLIAASSDTETIAEAFYVHLLTCPIGFTLQSGVCECDPVLSSYIDECYIDYSAIRRPANTWISAHTQANNTNYLMSDCPVDYCLPYSSNINLLHPDLQCQFNRTGILCSQCQHHLSMVFGSSRCMRCTNLHIFITVIVIVAGILLVVLLYLLNLTVTNGTINGIIFYANIVSINDSVFLVNDNVFKPLRVFISFTNLDLGIETCFYNGMDSYAKMFLQLFFPLYLIIIAVSIIIASRYSSRILRLTYTRSLPVLATLFQLSYTGVLRTVLTVLFSYSTITHLPSDHKQIVWSIDASVPLFGLKFTILFITCLVFFLLLIPFNITLLFTRHLLRFRMVYHFKPLLDAFQGSYKDRYYYWVAVHLTMRSFLFAMYAFQTSLKLILSTMLLMIFTVYNGRIYPHKNKLVNFQELLLLINLTIMYAVSYQSNESIFSIVTNVMISLAFIQFCTIVLYNFLTYTFHCNVETILQASKEKLVKFCYKNHTRNNHYFDVELLNIPERTYNYAEYQDGLVSDDFK